MTLFTSLLAVAVANVCLGYALAVGLGHGPPSLKAGWESLWARQPSPPEPATRDQPVDAP
jgi:hypothetical protein